MGNIEERLVKIGQRWQEGRGISWDEIAWLMGQLEAALKREAEYKDVLERRGSAGSTGSRE